MSPYWIRSKVWQSKLGMQKHEKEPVLVQIPTCFFRSFFSQRDANAGRTANTGTPNPIFGEPSKTPHQKDLVLTNELSLPIAEPCKTKIQYPWSLKTRMDQIQSLYMHSNSESLIDWSLLFMSQYSRIALYFVQFLRTASIGSSFRGLGIEHPFLPFLSLPPVDESHCFGSFTLLWASDPFQQFQQFQPNLLVEQIHILCDAAIPPDPQTRWCPLLVNFVRAVEKSKCQTKTWRPKSVLSNNDCTLQGVTQQECRKEGFLRQIALITVYKRNNMQQQLCHFQFFHVFPHDLTPETQSAELIWSRLILRNSNSPLLSSSCRKPHTLA